VDRALQQEISEDQKAREQLDGERHEVGGVAAK